MRLLRIFAINFQDVLMSRMEEFIYVLIAVFNPMLLLIFWYGALSQKSVSSVMWTLPDITAYYVLSIISGTFLVARIERMVAVIDIQLGGLTSHLLKPFPYFLVRLFLEFSWRSQQGLFALLVVIFINYFIVNIFSIPHDFYFQCLLFFSIIFAFMISFLFKMLVGISAFWSVDFEGLKQVIDVVFLIFGGFMVPIYFFPDWLATIAYLMPFPYVTYFPILAFQGKLSVLELVRVLGVQIGWLSILSGLYVYLWRKGLKTYTVIGQ